MRLSAPATAVVELVARKGQLSELQSRVMGALGLELPGAGKSAEVSGLRAAAIGPGRWMLLRPLEAGGDLADVVARAVTTAGAVVDQTGGRLLLRLAGPRARDTLAKGCRVDLHPRVFAAGAAVVTPIAHTPTVVILRDAAPTFDLVVPGSLAEPFAEWLIEAATEHGVLVEAL